MSLFKLNRLKKDYKSLGYSTLDISAYEYKIYSLPVYLTIMTLLSGIIMFNSKYKKSKILNIVLGIFLLILPGLYISGRLLFASYIAVIFNEGIVGSLKKSIEITVGKGWRVLGYLLAAVIPLILIMIIVLAGPAVLLFEKNMFQIFGFMSNLIMIDTNLRLFF